MRSKVMMHTVSIVSSILLYGFAVGGHAEDYRIGVVNALKVLEQAPQAEEARKRLEEEFADRDRKLVATQKELKTKEDKLAQDGAIMSESERSRLERDIINARRDLKRDQDEFREDLNFRRNEEFGKIQRLVVEAIQSEGAAQKFDIILGEGVIYASGKVDITDKVVERLKSKAAAAE